MNRFEKRKGISALLERLPKIGLALVIGAAVVGCAATDNGVTAPKIVAGAAHACAFDKDREQVVCWGDNSYGQLGNEEFSAEGVSAPVRVKVISGREIKSLSAGYSHTCALLKNGDDDTKNTVACWGYNHYGQVGNGTNQDVNVPVFVNGPDGNPLKGVATLTAGAYHTCASMAKGAANEGKVFCWGRNDKGQIGNGSLVNVNVPTLVEGLEYGGGVAAGTAHTCALTAKSIEDAQAKKFQVVCWGDASRGQMHKAKVAGGYSTKPVEIGMQLEGDPALFSEHVVQADVTTATGKPVKGEAALAAAPETPAYGQTCAISADQVQCWGGTNQNGQWGTMAKGVTQHTVKVSEVGGASSLVAYGAGNAQSCMLVGNGSDSSANEVACWGYSSSLGFAMPEDATDAVVAENRQAVTLQGSRPTGLAVGREFVCYSAKGEQPQIWCWGTGKKGQIGNARVDSTRVPQCVKGYCPDTKAKENLVEGQPFEEAPGPVPSVAQVSAGDSGTCAVILGGSVKCWGDSAFGDTSVFLNNESPDFGRRKRQRLFPAEVDDIGAPVLQVDAGEYENCALVEGGSVKCWGNHLIKMSPAGYHYEAYTRPVVADGFESKVTAFRQSKYGRCAVLADRSVRCRYSEIIRSIFDPIRELDFDSAPNAATPVLVGEVSEGQSCILVSGAVKCSDGAGFSNWTGFEAGVTAFYTNNLSYCGAFSDGRVNCHMYSSERGLSQVLAFEGLPALQSVEVGAGHACALTKAGGVKCWGDGEYGQLGNGASSLSYKMVDVQGLQAGVIAITVGRRHSCALLFGGVVKCWGANFDGQLGDGTVANSNVPVEVAWNGKSRTRGEITAEGTGLTEGLSTQKVTVTIPAVLGDVAYGFDCDGDGTYEVNGTVGGHECYYSKLGSGSYGIGYKITVQTLVKNDLTGTASFSVQNLPPVISAVGIGSGVIAAGSNEAKNFTITSVTASDPGGDALTYSYDCDLNGLIEGAKELSLGAKNAVCDLSALMPGTYSLSVVVTDRDHATQGSGETRKPITITIVPPLDTQIDSKPLAYSGADVSFTFSSADTDTIEYKLDSAAFAVTTSGMKSYTALTDGTHTFFARAVSGGNADASPASYTWIVDSIAPATVSDTTFTQPVGTNSVNISFHATDVNAGAGLTYQCQLDGSSWSSCTSGQSFGPVSSEGSHSLFVKATDAAGNATTSPATITWNYWIPPVTTLNASGPTQGSTINSNSASFSFASTTATSFQCSLDGGAYVTCTSPANNTGLGDGAHSFSVIAVRYGVPATTPSTRTWTVDTTGPNTTITSSFANDTSATSYNVVFSCGESGCSFECKVDTGSFATCTSPYTAAVSTEGQHTVTVRAYDALGNVDLSPASVNWTTTFPTGGGGGASVVTGATVSAGGSHACAVSSGAMYCWGFAGSHLGELIGPPEFNGHYLPTQMGSLTDWESVSAAGSSTHTCGIRASGALYCWGANSYGQLGDPNTSTFSGSAAPVQVAPGQTWHKVAAIDQHTCAIRGDQSLWCWGSNGSGELGLGFVSAFETGYSVTVPTQVGTNTNWIDVGGGYSSTCALNANGEMYCWGINSMGQLGVGNMGSFSAPMTAAATNVKAMTAGGEFACAVYNDRSLWCWGDNNVSQGGNAVSDRTLPSQVGTANDWASVEAGITHTCAIKTDATRWCWGDWTNNALGDDGVLSGTQATPLKIGSETDWLEITCGQAYCVGVRDTAGLDVFSWGDNQFNRAGVDVDTTPVVLPMAQLTPFP